eukprot:scaffold52163_cov75-Phaeocystis_antarctica.AAC.2
MKTSTTTAWRLLRNKGNNDNTHKRNVTTMPCIEYDSDNGTMFYFYLLKFPLALCRARKWARYYKVLFPLQLHVHRTTDMLHALEHGLTTLGLSVFSRRLQSKTSVKTSMKTSGGQRAVLLTKNAEVHTEVFTEVFSVFVKRTARWPAYVRPNTPNASAAREGRRMR